MKILKKLVSVFPFGFMKKLLYAKMLAELESIDVQFSSARKRYVDVLRDLYDCVKDVDIRLVEDFSLFKQQTIKVNLKSSQEAANLVLELLDNKQPEWESYFEHLTPDREERVINWYSNERSINTLLMGGLQVISYYSNYITYKDARLATPDVNLAPPFSSELMGFFDSKQFKLLVTDLITVYWLALDSNVSR
ncbi:hypothetical protein NFI00_000157 [Salmonella enterica]|nr:hypothetical protein [Salmonella enterica]